MPIDAYRKDNGEKVRIPEVYLRIFPGVFSKTPRQKAAERAVTAKQHPTPKTSAAVETNTKEA